MRVRRFFGALLVLVIVLSLTLKMELLFGWSFDLALAALVAFALIVSGPELVLLLAFALFVLRSSPGFSPELLVLAAVPLLAALGDRLLPWRSAMTPAVALAFGIVGFYLAAGSSLGAYAWFLAGNVIVCIAFAYVLLWMFQSVWSKNYEKYQR